MREALDTWIDDVGDKGEVSEVEMLGTMWPGLEQPITRSPQAEFANGGNEQRALLLHSDTAGASIGYRVDGGKWQLYTRPFIVDAGSTVEAKAIRYGYKESPVSIVAVR